MERKGSICIARLLIIDSSDLQLGQANLVVSWLPCWRTDLFLWATTAPGGGAGVESRHEIGRGAGGSVSRLLDYMCGIAWASRCCIGNYVRAGEEQSRLAYR